MAPVDQLTLACTLTSPLAYRLTHGVEVWTSFHSAMMESVLRMNDLTYMLECNMQRICLLVFGGDILRSSCNINDQLLGNGTRYLHLNEYRDIGESRGYHGPLVMTVLDSMLFNMHRESIPMDIDPLIASVPLPGRQPHHVLIVDVPTLIFDPVYSALRTRAHELGGRFSLFVIPIPNELNAYMM